MRGSNSSYAGIFRHTAASVYGNCGRCGGIDRRKENSMENLKITLIQLVSLAKEYFDKTRFDKADNACNEIAKLLDELQVLRDNQGQGLLIPLKVKPGDRVYIIERGCIVPKDIVRIDITMDSIEYVCFGRSFTEDSFGKTVFLTETKAEKALANREPVGMKNVILQKEDTRYAFTGLLDRPTDKRKVCVAHETKFSSGHGTMSHDYISVEKAEAKVRDLIEEGYIKFRTVSEVSWYATRPNNTPYEETWEIKDGFFIPKESHSVSVTTIDGNRCALVDFWGDGIGWTTKYYVGRKKDEDGEWYYAKAVVSDGEYKGTYCFEYGDRCPDRDEVENDLTNHLSALDIDRKESEIFTATGIM